MRPGTRVRIPDGFVVDELPAPVSVDTAFGSYSSRCTSSGNDVIVERSIVLRGGTVASSDCAGLNSFLDQIEAAERAPVVLVAK